MWGKNEENRNRTMLASPQTAKISNWHLLQRYVHNGQFPQRCSEGSLRKQAVLRITTSNPPVVSRVHVNLMCPGELTKYAVPEGTRAITKYSEARTKYR